MPLMNRLNARLSQHPCADKVYDGANLYLYKREDGGAQ